ncbi:MAG: hypothetical protein WD960_06865 [Gemmatimonadota bacterium]
MTGFFVKLGDIVAISSYRRVGLALAAGYLVLFLIALQDISLGGRGFEFLTTNWDRMFDRRGTMTFEPIARITFPGLTILLSPLNILMGAGIAFLAGLNLVITWIAFRQPSACRFNRSTGILASVPALLAGSACCAPAIVLILGLQVSSVLISAFQILVPVSAVLLVVTLKLIVDRTDTELLGG